MADCNKITKNKIHVIDLLSIPPKRRDINFFTSNSTQTEMLSTQIYDSENRLTGSFNNRYLTVKLVYSLDYGKKTVKPSKYKGGNVESAILK